MIMVLGLTFEQTNLISRLIINYGYCKKANPLQAGKLQIAKNTTRHSIRHTLFFTVQHLTTYHKKTKLHL